ncbi:carboxymuconolactone decarboxylase family protein [Nitrosomonas supralitoralis]|uniref:Peroxidase n=1 Tax=Nitrosomonas supralitoralis TaxID=2116706 RepID=A0A2P7NW23_9PROT|nr:peroxidase-related enzyme [Nitrosomonas supralitoralis]PSJ17648.1 peroxidase [Nitrosomonas supralitoralis]
MLQADTEKTSESSAILLEIGKTFGGHVPNIFKAYAEHPPLLAANWEKFKAIMLQGKLRRKVKEAIASVISYDNKCIYCVAAHSAALRSMKVSESEIDEMFQGTLPNDFTDKEIALVKFARRANLDWHNIGNVELKKLVDLGIEDSEVLEAFGTMELFIAFNRFADVMGIEIDF